MKFVNHIDLQKFELRNARVQNLAAAPSSPVEGQIYHNTADHTLKFYNGSGWITLNDIPDATTATKGIIQLAGDLSGTAAAPVIADGAITNAKVSASAAIDRTKLASTGTDVATIQQANAATDTAAAPGFSWSDDPDTGIFNSAANTLGFAANGASLGTWNSTGLTLVSGDHLMLSTTGMLKIGTTANDVGFKRTGVNEVTVRNGNDTGYGKILAEYLQTNSGALLGGELWMNSQRIRDIADPVDPIDAASKGYVDAAISGFTVARGIITGSNDPNNPPATSSDGYTLAVGDRVLIPTAAVDTRTGIWIFQGAGVPMVRPSGYTPDTGSVVYLTGARRIYVRSGTPAVAGGIPRAWTSAFSFENTFDIGVTGDIQMYGYRVMGLYDPVLDDDAATKQYVDNVVSGISNAKVGVRVASTENVSLGQGPERTIDGVTGFSRFDRVLLKNQTNPAENGIYVITWITAPSINTILIRAGDMNSWEEVPGAYVWVEEGATHADSGWLCTADRGGTLETTPITWVQFSGLGQVTVGSGLTKDGNLIYVPPGGIDTAHLAVGAVQLGGTKIGGILGIANGGTGSFSASGARTNLNAAGIYSSATHAAGTAIQITQGNHGLAASRALIVQVMEEATGDVVAADVTVGASGSVTVNFGSSVAANSHRVTIFG